MVETTFLGDLFSTLFLPLFLIVILAGMAGVRPDGIISGYAGILIALVSGVFRIALGLLSTLMRELPGLVLGIVGRVRKSGSRETQEASGEKSPGGSQAQQQAKRKIYIQED